MWPRLGIFILVLGAITENCTTIDYVDPETAAAVASELATDLRAAYANNLLYDDSWRLPSLKAKWRRPMMQDDYESEQFGDDGRDRVPVGLRVAPASRAPNRLRDKILVYQQNISKRRTNVTHIDKRQPMMNDFPTVSKRHQRELAYISSPLSDQILEVGEHLRKGYQNSIAMSNDFKIKDVPKKLLEVTDDEPGECRTLRSSIQLEKDDHDPASGQLIRTCRGMVQVNRCDGFCVSNVQPSIKSPTGFKKVCFCCNEGSFRKIQVRLADCFWALDNRRIETEEDAQRSYMYVDVEEPTECKCRSCDGFA